MNGTIVRAFKKASFSEIHEVVSNIRRFVLLAREKEGGGRERERGGGEGEREMPDNFTCIDEIMTPVSAGHIILI